MKLNTLITSLAALTMVSFTGACKPAATVETEPATTSSETTQEAGTDPAATLTVKDVDAAAAAALIESDAEVIVLDVRTPEEFGQGHIAGALNIDVTAPGFKDEVAKLDKGKRYLVHCRSGARSTQSLAVFKDLGFSEIHHMNGGFNEWAGAGQPVSTE